MEAHPRRRLGLVWAALAHRRGASAVHWSTGATVVRIEREEGDVGWRVMLSIFVDGDYATDYSDAVVADVGAHKGYFGAYALAKGARTVASYEPSSDNLASLQRAAASLRDGRRNWAVHHAAVGARSGEARLRLSPQSWSHVVVPDAYAPTDTELFETVRVVPMTQVLADLEPADRVIVKIDAEGAECAILRDTPSEGWSRVSELFVEIEPGSECSIDDARSYLAASGLMLHRRTAPAVYHFRRGP